MLVNVPSMTILQKYINNSLEIKNINISITVKP